MASALKHIGGGLLQGLGKGLAAQGLEKRKRARAQLLENQKDQRQTRTIDAADARQKRRIGADIAAAKLKTTRATAAAKLTSERKDSRDRLKSARLSPKDAWDIALESGTHKDPNTGEDTIRWNLVRDSLTENGFANLARTAKRRFGDDTSVANLKAAHAKATAEAEEKTSVLKSRGSEFPKDGGSMKKFIARRAGEILRELNAAAGGAPDAGAPGAVIDITGTAAERKQKLNSVPIGGTARIKGVLYIRQPGGGFLPADDPLAGAGDAAVKERTQGRATPR